MSLSALPGQDQGMTLDATVPARPSLGITFVPTLPPEQLIGLAQTADREGLDVLWVWEDCFAESGVTTAAAALASTSRLRVGIALLPVPLRNVAVTAMEFATLERLFPGRLIAGVGHGVQDWMGQVGARVRSPLTLLREYTTALRALLAGERVTTTGEYVRLDGVALNWPPSPAPPLMVGGEGPKSLRLAAELGDGLLLGGGTNAQVASAIAVAQEVRGPGFPVVTNHIVSAGAGAQERLDRELRIWSRPTGEGVGAAGDGAAIAASIDRLAKLGCTHIAVQPTADEPDLHGLVHLLAHDVQSQVGASQS